MVKIIDKINCYCASGQEDPFFSYEFFPPKTETGVENLYNRIEHMIASGPQFINVTWGAGGCTRDSTMGICEYVQMYLGVDVLMHLTCTHLKVTEIKDILDAAKAAGIRNILALRGDPPKGHLRWEPVEGGLLNAIDLVRFIRSEYGDYFCVAVAGFPEGHPSSVDKAADIQYLKEKVDAGADFILTQFFYDPDVFVKYMRQCKSAGIHCPIIPGMMPIQSYSSFTKMTSYCRTHVPEHIWSAMLPIRENDEEVKALGVQLCADMCKELFRHGVKGFHFYTLNLEKSVLEILKVLEISKSAAKRRALPWRGSRSTDNGKEETVRPINWANRPRSYIRRTDSWDEFPNGRWGNPLSPAFGELSNSHFFKPFLSSEQLTLRATESKDSASAGSTPTVFPIPQLLATSRRLMWGDAPFCHQDIYEVFAQYVEGRIPSLPWCESVLHAETSVISSQLADLNRAGILTVNSQPAVNAAKSDDPVFGWGGSRGYVYQKAYVEFFVSPALLTIIRQLVSQRPNLSLYAVNNARSEDVCPSEYEKSVTTLTWGVFSDKEIQQPTVFTWQAFTVWSEEAFQLWLTYWASLYDDETDSCGLLYDIHDSFFLVAIVDNNYIESELFSCLMEILQFLKGASNGTDSSILKAR